MGVGGEVGRGRGDQGVLNLVFDRDGDLPFNWSVQINVKR